jgi:hypothetical protein
MDVSGVSNDSEVQCRTGKVNHLEASYLAPLYKIFSELLLIHFGSWRSLPFLDLLFAY